MLSRAEMTIDADLFRLADLTETAPDLARHLGTSANARAALNALIERAFQAGRTRERLGGPDRDLARRPVRRLPAPHAFPVSVLPVWLSGR